jgi:hypothetical protein
MKGRPYFLAGTALVIVLKNGIVNASYNRQALQTRFQYMPGNY